VLEQIKKAFKKNPRRQSLGIVPIKITGKSSPKIEELKIYRSQLQAEYQRTGEQINELMVQRIRKAGLGA